MPNRYRLLTGTCTNVDGKPAANKTLLISLNKNDFTDEGSIQRFKVKVKLTNAGAIPAGVSVWCNADGNTGSLLRFDEPDSTEWFAVLEYGAGGPINISDLRVQGGVVLPSPTFGAFLEDSYLSYVTAQTLTTEQKTQGKSNLGISDSVATGDVSGPVDSVTRAVAVFSDTSGKEIDDSVLTITPDGDLSGLRNSTQTGYMDISEIDDPLDPAANTVRLFAVDHRGNTRLQYRLPDGTKIQIARDNIHVVRNRSGVPLVKGQCVYITGGQGASGTAEVSLAMASSSNTSPSFAVVMEPIATNQYGRAMASGKLEDLDTSGTSEGDTLYLSPSVPGAFTTVKPDHPNLIQVIGVVINNHATLGVILVRNAAIRGDANGTIQSSFLVGDGTAGPKYIGFSNDFPSTVGWDPSASRALSFPDKSGVISVGKTNSVTLINPSESENVTMLFTDVPITVSKAAGVLTGSVGQSVSWDIRFGSTRDSSGTSLVGNSSACTSITSAVTYNSFSNDTIPANSFVWLVAEPSDRTVRSFHLTLFYGEVV